jgi:hypothetical protein
MDEKPASSTSVAANLTGNAQTAEVGANQNRERLAIRKLTDTGCGRYGLNGK